MTDYLDIKYKQPIERITEAAKKIRFDIIDSAISIETSISQILIDTLATEKTRKSIDKYLFSETLTFDNKVTLFNSFVKDKVFDKEKINKTLGGDLEYIKKLRNLMAHSMLDTSVEFMDIYNDTYIRFKSFTQKGIIDITVNFHDTTENINENTYSHKVLIEKINKSIDTLDRI